MYYIYCLWCRRKNWNIIQVPKVVNKSYLPLQPQSPSTLKSCYSDFEWVYEWLLLNATFSATSCREQLTFYIYFWWNDNDVCFVLQGLTVIFSYRQVYVKREGRTLFLLPKVKVEFRHLFSLRKRFSLCSYHNINANIVVFCWLTGLQCNNTRF